MSLHKRILIRLLVALTTTGLLSNCGTSAKKKDGDADKAEKVAAKEEKEQDGGGVDPATLLNMSWKEASAISAQKLEIPPFFKVAAEEIQVVRQNKDGSPRTVRAKGKVFLQIDFREPAVALCQEAYFGDEEVILRGRPLLQRGGSVLEGLSAGTVFYMLGLRLRVIGLHRLTNEGQVMTNMPMYGPWESGPNPLLPPLSPSAVPESVRQEMLKAAEAEAVLWKSKIGPVEPLKEGELLPPPPTDKPAADEKTKPSDKPAEPEKKPDEKPTPEAKPDSKPQEPTPDKKPEAPVPS